MSDSQAGPSTGERLGTQLELVVMKRLQDDKLVLPPLPTVAVKCLEIIQKTDPKLAANPLLFPSEEIRKGFHPYPNLTPADEREMEERMAQVTGA